MAGPLLFWPGTWKKHHTKVWARVDCNGCLVGAWGVSIRCSFFATFDVTFFQMGVLGAPYSCRKLKFSIQLYYFIVLIRRRRKEVLLYSTFLPLFLIFDMNTVPPKPPFGKKLHQRLQKKMHFRDPHKTPISLVWASRKKVPSGGQNPDSAKSRLFSPTKPYYVWQNRLFFLQKWQNFGKKSVKNRRKAHVTFGESTGWRTPRFLLLALALAFQILALLFQNSTYSGVNLSKSL